MKKIFHLIFILIAAVSMQAQTLDNALYVYRNDGDFNGFLREDVDSIALSYFDLDSIRHSEPVCQVFYTSDSIFRIPIEAIDSVSFVQPKTILQPGVISLEGDLRASVKAYEDGKILFKKDSEKYHHFNIGDKLVTLEMSEMFPMGFIGEVIDVSENGETISVTCCDTDMEEVFYSYCSVINRESKNDSKNANSPKHALDINKTFVIPPLSYSWDLSGSVDILPDAQFGLSGTTSASLNPKFTVKGFDLVDPDRGRIIDIKLIGEYEIDNSFDFSVGISARKEISFFPVAKEYEVPIAPLLSFFFDAGLYLEGSANISFSKTQKSSYVSFFNIKLVEHSVEPSTPIIKETSRWDNGYQLALKGRVAGGVYVEAGVKPWIIDKDAMSKISLSADFGLELENTKGFDFEDLKQASFKTALYDAVSLTDGVLANNLYIGGYAALKFNVRWNPIDFTWTIGQIALGDPIYQGGLFPYFSDIHYEPIGNLNEIYCKCSTSRLCPYDYEVGFAVFDSEGNKLKTEYYPTPYSKNPFLRFDEYGMNLSGIEKNKNYKIYPCLKVFGYDVLASPSIDVFNERLVDISNFSVTHSEYQENGFNYEGSDYSYMFNTSVELKLNNTLDVEDWGYVYRDPNGKDTFISLAQFGNSYTDTRYAYFRNSAESSVTLFGYVKYYGTNVYHCDKPQIFELKHKEEEHPYMVDLGLSVKWASCNVGAKSPGDFGGYYAWGETYEKNEYNSVNHNADFDISGTDYDVAHVKWGGNWRMPRLQEFQELINQCTWVWFPYGYTCGWTVIGPNGNSIFLPAAGFRFGSSPVLNELRVGYYWTSTPIGDDTSAHLLYFLYERQDFEIIKKYVGASVRPVCD